MKHAFQSERITRAIGIHVSIAGKLDRSVDRAIEVGCVGAFQIFTCSPRRWDAASLKYEEVQLFRKKVKENNFQAFAHMPYLPNLSSPDEIFYEKSVKVLVREVIRCEALGIQSLVLHFGSHLGSSTEYGVKRIADGCKKCLKDTAKCSVRLLLENSAGTKNSIGHEFSMINQVLMKIGDYRRTGVCLDTCHAFAAGYDLRTPEALSETISKFDSALGLKNLHLIHLNDSKGVMGDRLDRHERIGEGKIGLDGMRALINSKELISVPIVLETPVVKEGDDKRNIETVKRLILDYN